MTHNVDESQNLKSKYFSYHRNLYFIQLNEAIKDKNEIPLSMRKHQAQMIADKHIIDITLLNRNGEYKKNLDFYVAWVNRVRTLEPGPDSVDSLVSYLKSLNTPEAQKQVTYLNALLLNNSSVSYESTSISNNVKDTISAINNPRLDHAVWSRNLAEIFILYLGVVTPELSKLLKIVALCNGFASYGFYIVRGGIDAICGIKNLSQTDVFVKEEITRDDQVKFQTEQRYQRIANDILLWAPVNFLTFHYLTGPGKLGMIGNYLTVGLLIGDLCLALYGYSHKVSQFSAIKDDIEKEIEKIQAQIDTLAGSEAEQIKKLTQEKEQLNKYLDKLTEAHHKDLEKLRYQLYYQGALVVAFAVLLANTMPCMIGAALTIFALQLFINIKDLCLQLRDEQDAKNRSILKFQITMKAFEHLMLPGLFVVVGLFVMPLIPLVSPWLVFFATATIGYNLLQFTNYITKMHAQYMNTGKLDWEQLVTDFGKNIVLPGMMMACLFALTSTMFAHAPAAVVLAGLFFLSNNLVQLGEKLYNCSNQESTLKFKAA
jgi:hypothetical protein